MNPYRCETCSYHPLHGKILKCPYDGAGIDEQIYYTLKEEMRLPRAAELFTSIVGCASHSDFQSERDKVLDELEKRITEEEPVFLFTILGYIKELRQAGESNV